MRNRLHTGSLVLFFSAIQSSYNLFNGAFTGVLGVSSLTFCVSYDLLGD
jgi:hypothetical protein